MGAMFPTKIIVGNAVNFADRTTLVAAPKPAGLIDVLSGTAHSLSSLRSTQLSRNCVAITVTNDFLGGFWERYGHNWFSGV